MEEKDVNKESRRDFLKFGFGLGLLTVATAGATTLLANSEPDKTQAEEKVKLLTTDGKLVEVDKSAIKCVKCEPADRQEAHKGLPNRKFAMVIDLGKCKNVRACVDACQEGHHLAKDHEWMKVYLMQDSEATAPYWFPRPCYHCDTPMCVSVCPVGATYKRSDGIVLIDTERCIGCKFCMTGCPYSVRVFHWKEPESAKADASIPYSPETGIPAVEGTVSKCVFCADKLRLNQLPRCVEACPMGVIYFGDIIEDTVTNGSETIRFSTLIKDRSGYRHLESLGTAPSVYYLPPVNRMFPVERGFDDLDEDVKNRYNNTEFVKSTKKEPTNTDAR